MDAQLLELDLMQLRSRSSGPSRLVQALAQRNRRWRRARSLGALVDM